MGLPKQGLLVEFLWPNLTQWWNWELPVEQKTFQSNILPVNIAERFIRPQSFPGRGNILTPPVSWTNNFKTRDLIKISWHNLELDGVDPDLLKVICFVCLEFSLIKFCTELCTKNAIKPVRFEKTTSNCAKIMKKCLFYKFRVQKFKFCADSRKFCADMRLPSVHFRSSG